MPSSSLTSIALIVALVLAIFLHSMHWRADPAGQRVIFDLVLVVLVAAVVVLISEARHS